MAFAKPKASTTARGYGTSHTKTRAAAIAQHYDGAPCALCRHPMYGPTSGLDLDHCPHCKGTGCASCSGQGYRGLAHGRTRCRTCGLCCNRSDGGRRGRARQTTTAHRM
jgi:hypothetical protein